MKKSLWLTGLLLVSLLANLAYANDTIRWTWQTNEQQWKSIEFSGTEDGAFAVDWGDGKVTEVTGSGSYWGSWFSHEYADAGRHAVLLYALTADAGITYLSCSGSSVTTLDAGACPSLERLSCYNNRLTSLDVSGCTSLTSLTCYDNQLTSLDVSGCESLRSLDISNNKMSFRAVAEMALALPSEQLDGFRRFAPQIHPKLSVRPGGSVAVPELPVIKGTRAHLDVYRNGVRVVNQGYTVEDGQLHFTEIGEYKLVVWHDSVQEYKYISGNDEGYKWMPYGDTTCLVVCDEYVAGNDVVYWTWQKSLKYDRKRQLISFSGTAGEKFVIDWGDGERMLVDGTGEMVEYSHNYAEEALSVHWRLYGTTPSARILGFGKDDNSSERPLKDNESLDVSHCPELTYLDLGYFNMTGKGLMSLDVSKNVKLEYLECSSNQLTSLDVSKNVNLKHLSCEGNRLLSLDVSKNVNLEYLNCRGHYLTSLDVSKNIALMFLCCEDAPITSLDLSKNVNLERLDCYNTKLTSLDLSKNVKLKYLDCGLSQYVSLDLSKNVNLEFLDCWSNYLTSLDLSKNVKLEYLNCGRNNLVSLNVSRNVNLVKLFCNGNSLTSLDVSQNGALKELNCSANRLAVLTLDNANMETLSCWGNRLTALDISRNTALTSLDCDQNRLTSLDVSQQPDLISLSCKANRLTSLDLSGQLGYVYYVVWDRNFREVTLDGQRAFDLSVLPGLDVDRISSVRGGRLDGSRLIFEADEVEYDYATGYQREGGDCSFDTVSFRLISDIHSERQIPLTAEFFPDDTFRAYVAMFDKDGNDSLCEHERAVVGGIYVNGSSEGPRVYWREKVESVEGIQYFPNLKELECGAAALTSLDVSRNKALVFVYCPNNYLTSLTVGDNPVLEELYCFGNRLTELEIGNCPSLAAVDCHDNRIERLEISDSPALHYLYCMNNKLSDLDVSRFPVLRSLVCIKNDLSDLDLSANPELVEITAISFNHFPLSKIAALWSAWPNDEYDEENVCFSPQYIIAELSVGGVLDLSSEMQLAGVETEVDFGDMAEEAYTFADGRLQFNKAGTYEFRLSNAALRNMQATWDEYWDRENNGVGGVDVFYQVKVGSDTPSDTTANEATLAAAPFAYVQGHTVYLTDGLGEVEALTVMGQRVYKGFGRAITLPRPGVYILRVVADGRRCKIIVR